MCIGVFVFGGIVLFLGCMEDIDICTVEDIYLCFMTFAKKCMAIPRAVPKRTDSTDRLLRLPSRTNYNLVYIKKTHSARGAFFVSL